MILCAIFNWYSNIKPSVIAYKVSENHNERQDSKKTLGQPQSCPLQPQVVPRSTMFQRAEPYFI